MGERFNLFLVHLSEGLGHLDRHAGSFNGSRASNGLLIRSAICAAIATASVSAFPQPAEVAPDTQPQTIDDLVVSIRNHLNDDFLCWEIPAIERYWSLEFASTRGLARMKNHEVDSTRNRTPGRSVEKYDVDEQTFQRNGVLYRGVSVNFRSLQYPPPPPEISHLRLYEVFGKPSVVKGMFVELAPPAPGKPPIVFKREGNFQQMYMEWTSFGPNVLLIATTGFRSELKDLFALKRTDGGCK